MQPQLHIGALIDRAPGRKYTAALRFAEYAPRTPLPKPKTLATVRAGLPADFVLALRAPRSSVVSQRGPLRIDAQLEAGLQWLCDAADALAARVVVFTTPAELTPGARSRDLLRQYVGRLPRVDGRHYVWRAHGLWEPADVRGLCEQLGLTFAFDPLETTPNPSEIAYATLRALGHRSGFSLGALSDALANTVQHGPREAFLSVDADHSFNLAKRLQALATGGSAALDGDDADDADQDDDGLDPDADTPATP